jgi:hypothetical protein
LIPDLENPEDPSLKNLEGLFTLDSKTFQDSVIKNAIQDYSINYIDLGIYVGIFTYSMSVNAEGSMKIPNVTLFNLQPFSTTYTSSIIIDFLMDSDGSAYFIADRYKLINNLNNT